MQPIKMALAASLLFLSHAALAQTWPDTPAAQRTKAWIEAFNADGDEAMKVFIAQSFMKSAVAEKGAETIATRFLGMKKQTGKLKVESVAAIEDGVTVIALAELPNVKLEVTGHVEKEAPHYLKGVGAKPAK